METCTHCWEQISEATWPVHLTGPQRGLHRCATTPYGYEAHRDTQPCADFPCRGARFPDETPEVTRG